MQTKTIIRVKRRKPQFLVDEYELSGLVKIRFLLQVGIECFRLSVIRRAKTGHSSAPKTGHHVGGTRWKNRLIRFCWQGA